MPSLKLHLLGPPQVELDGAACNLHSNKALALLAYLAVTHQPHSRAKLATLFWPEQSESRALAYLRHTLWTLRKAVGDAWFDSEAEMVHIPPHPDLWVDVTAFLEHLAAGRHAEALSLEGSTAYLSHLQAAVELYRDDLLAGFSLRDSPAFDEWQFFQSEQLRRQLATTLQQLVRGYNSRGEYPAAIPYARRWLALDALHEPAHQLLMQLYAWSGQRAAAVRQYRECRRILREELDAPPSEETQALYQQLQTGSFQAPTPFPTAHQTSTPSPAQVAPPAAPPTSAEDASREDELRFVTVLCVGLCLSADNAVMVESTVTDDFTDSDMPDVLAGQIATLLTLVEAALAPNQAQVEQLLGGVVLALFGAQTVHEDDAERALHAALTIQQAAASQHLPINIGISSGLVYIGPFTPAAHTPVSALRQGQRAQLPQCVVLGTVVNLATYLQVHGEPGVCLVSKTIYRQTRGIFRLQPHLLYWRDAAAPLTAYQLQGKQATPRKLRGIEGLPAQLVGRREELGKLQALAGLVSQGTGQLAAIIGEAGVGKSRLLLEFHVQLPRRAPGWLWLEGRCQEMAQGAGYAPFIDLLRAYWQWRPEETAAVRVSSLHTLLADLSEDQHLRQADVGELAALLGRLLGLHFGNEWDRRLDQVDVHEVQRRTAGALCELFVALAHRQPLILALEDLHWADTLSLELINLLMPRLAHAPLLLLCVYRPEQSRRSWQLATTAAHKCPGHFCQLDLHALTPDQSRLLIANLLGGETLPGRVALQTSSAKQVFPEGMLAQEAMLPSALSPTVQQLILNKAQGNPLFLEELIYAMIDTGLLVREQGRWRAVTDIKLTAVPESLQSIIFARLDHLGSPWKQVLQQAAVIGRTFRRRLLAELTPPAWNLDDALQRLSDAAFLYQERLYPEEEYSFRHVLVQEAIYHGLIQRQRRQLHRQVAQSIERLAGERVQDHIDLLAHHWSRGSEPVQAIHYLLLAGDKAQAALAYHEAAAYYRRAVGFLKEQGEPTQTARALMKLGNSYHSASEFRRARQAFDDCFALNQEVVMPVDSSPIMTHTLRLAWGEPYSLDPIHTGATAAIAVVQQLFSPLVLIGPTFEIMPAVAERWEVLQGGRRYIFHLRHDVLWSDGAPVTAHDYALTLRRILAPASFDNMASLFYPIKHGEAYHTGAMTDPAHLGIAVADDHTLVIDLELPTSYFLQSLTCAAAHPTPAHLFAKHGEAWQTPGIMVVNGPFQVAEWQRGHALILERNRMFFGQTTGNVGRIELCFNLTVPQQVERYATEELDLLWLNDLDASDREALRQRHPAAYRTLPLLNVLLATFDTTQPPFTDRRVRQALVHALDREALVNTALGGYEQPAHGGLIPVGLPGHSPDIGLGFDPVRARFLLQEAGYADPSRFPSVTAFAWRSAAPVCSALSEQWCRHLGLTIAWQVLEYPDFLRRRFEERPALFLFGWACDYPDAHLFLDMFVNIDLTHWSNAEFLRLFAEAQHTLAPAQRLALLAQADRIAMAEAAVMPLYYERLQFLLQPRITRYPLSPFRWWFWKDVVIEPPIASQYDS